MLTSMSRQTTHGREPSAPSLVWDRFQQSLFARSSRGKWSRSTNLSARESAKAFLMRLLLRGGETGAMWAETLDSCILVLLERHQVEIVSKNGINA